MLECYSVYMKAWARDPSYNKRINKKKYKLKTLHLWSVLYHLMIDVFLPWKHKFIKNKIPYKHRILVVTHHSIKTKRLYRNINKTDDETFSLIMLIIVSINCIPVE